MCDYTTSVVTIFSLRHANVAVFHDFPHILYTNCTKPPLSIGDNGGFSIKNLCKLPNANGCVECLLIGVRQQPPGGHAIAHHIDALGIGGKELLGQSVVRLYPQGQHIGIAAKACFSPDASTVSTPFSPKDVIF